ncbi:helix-turn-helix domain-containing protein [Chromobacterium haemolyticum]|uniref:helix-turn-helix domain-containing protein n=1 Tax=Chromobacterium haemolyticum TaxID=394935 RepID=UPI001178C7E5|nr:helix-turn-helix domain-containing protein [Chromobacterium haemolyticum]
MIRERTQAGLAAVRARGKAGDRKPKLDEQQVPEIKVLLSDLDIQVADVAHRYGVARTTLYKHVGVIVPCQLGRDDVHRTVDRIDSQYQNIVARFAICKTIELMGFY